MTNMHNFTVGAPANPGVGKLDPIDRTTLKKMVPSVFAEQPHPKVSGAYKFVKTVDILDTLSENGFQVVQARQSSARDETGIQYVKHMLRLAHADYIGKGIRKVGDVVPEIVLTNSHNRTSAFVLEAGLFRLICSNGLMAAATSFAGARVLHNDPQIYAHIVSGAEAIQNMTHAVAIPMIEKMQKLRLSKSQQDEFAVAATLLKWGTEKPDQAAQLLAPRRAEDEGDSLWAVMNRVQENAVKGGYRAQDRSGRNMTVHGIKSVDRDREFNLDLWNLTAEIAEHA